MPRYKRTRDEAELDLPSEPAMSAEHTHILTKLRNMWETASLMQYIYMFGSIAKIDEDFDIEVHTLPSLCCAYTTWANSAEGEC